MTASAWKLSLNDPPRSQEQATPAFPLFFVHAIVARNIPPLSHARIRRRDAKMFTLPTRLPINLSTQLKKFDVAALE